MIDFGIGGLHWEKYVESPSLHFGIHTLEGYDSASR